MNIDLDQMSLLNIKESLAIIKLGKTTWYKGIDEGVFPPPVKYDHSSRWTTEAIKLTYLILAGLYVGDDYPEAHREWASKLREKVEMQKLREMGYLPRRPKGGAQ